ncbi:MAG TPA: arylesterase [Bryobacteraceae bacterium]|nr:arylesterase [Bryobacteraceae bacterium]
MHSVCLVSLIVTLLVCAGCTNTPNRVESEPVTRAATPVERPATADTRPIIVAFGDSISEGLGVATGKSFPDQLQQKLDTSGFSYRVVNLGVSGDTTTGGVGRLDYAISMKPAVVILELGGNDGLRGIPVASTKANLEKMIGAFQKAGASVVLAGMTLPPNYGPEYIQQFEAAYKDLARKYKVTLIPFLMEDILAQYKAKPGLMQSDGIHPTAEGHEIIADTVMRYLQKVIKPG